LKNKTEANLIFSVELAGRFVLYDSKTNSPSKYDLSLSRSTLNKGPETKFNLIPGSLVELFIEFEGYNEKDHENWPLAPIARLPGMITINYANGDFQTIELEGSLLRPVLQLNTVGFEGRKAEEVIEFELTHIKNVSQKVLYLSNISKVPAKWKLNYLKYPTKNTIAMATMTKLEIEDREKTDDPSVFEFSVTEVIIIYFLLSCLGHH